MIYKSKLSICVCGHNSEHHINSICQDKIPDNKGKTHVDELKLTQCKCRKLDIAVDLSRENIHIKDFGNY